MALAIARMCNAAMGTKARFHVPLFPGQHNKPMNSSRGWLLLCALHGVASMLLWWAPTDTQALLTWQADQGPQRAWTLWTSAWVHLNTPHLIGNQMALGVLTAFAWVLRPPLASALAWLFAWPLVQASLPLWPQIGHATGLSGVLHAGVAVLAVQLLQRRIAMPRARRWGLLLGLGLLLKLGLERGWNHPVVWDTANHTSVVRGAHLAGAFWGLWLGLLASWLLQRQRPATAAPGDATPKNETGHP